VDEVVLASEVHVHHLVPLLRAEVADPLVAGDRGVVDDRDHVGSLLHVRDDLVDAFVVANVGDVAHDVVEPPGDFLDRVVDVDAGHEVVALAEQVDGRSSDTAGRAGHDGCVGHTRLSVGWDLRVRSVGRGSGPPTAVNQANSGATSSANRSAPLVSGKSTNSTTISSKPASR
jgi:hypothetical protein